MRGEAQNLDIDLMCVERFFNEIDRIKKIIFTGGEPSLVPEILSDIIDIAKSKNVFLDFFEISTNAVSVSDTFIETILKIFDYCKDKKNTCIAVSLDDPHERASRYTHLNEIEKIEMRIFITILLIFPILYIKNLYTKAVLLKVIPVDLKRKIDLIQCVWVKNVKKIVFLAIFI
jgi:organic radical activating enzyme